MTTLLKVATEDFPESFDPAASTVAMTIDAAAHTVYNRLVHFRRGTTDIEPGLAHAWQAGSGARRWRFSLRQGVCFHANPWFQPSRPLDARDVVFTFERLCDRLHGLSIPSVDSPYAKGMGLAGLLEQVTAIDDLTVEFSLSRPHAPLAHDLATAFASIQSLEYAQVLSQQGQGERFVQHPVGTGPFAFDAAQGTHTIRYRAHEAYFEGRAPVDTLEFRVGHDPAQRIRMLANGEVDIALYPNPQDIEAIAHRPDLQVMTAPSLMTSYLAFNLRRPVMRQDGLREALCRAIDRQRYLDLTQPGNRARVALGPLPKGVGTQSDLSASFGFDPERARWLVAHHGLAGTRMDILSRASRSTVYPLPQEATEFFIEAWSRLGLRAQARYLEVTDFYRQRNKDAYDVALCGWTGDNGDPDNFFSLLTTPAIESGMNYAGYSDPKFDAWVDAGRSAVEPAQRQQAYDEVLRRFAQVRPWLPLAQHTMFAAVSRQVKGYRMSPFGDNNFFGVSLAPLRVPVPNWGG